MPPRPPKPDDQAARPRYRKRRSGHRAIFDALSRLTNAEMGRHDISDFVSEIGRTDNPRGAAILLATHLENALQIVLVERLRVQQEHFDDIFGSERSPMGTFDSKTRVAHAVGLITDNTRLNLDIIRRVRNAFAHAMTPISFGTKEVMDACAVLLIPDPYPPTISPWSSPDDPVTDPAWRYRRTCEILSHNCYVVAGCYRVLSPTNQLPGSF
jgi:hypothetical protein